MTGVGASRRPLAVRALPLVLALLAPPVLGADAETCRQLREQREALGREAMREELALVRTVRERLCPELSRQADAANAVDGVFDPIDFGALRDCRRRAEAELEGTRAVLYRNRRAFPFYSRAGAGLARRADGVAERMEGAGCPPLP